MVVDFQNITNYLRTALKSVNIVANGKINSDPPSFASNPKPTDEYLYKVRCNLTPGPHEVQEGTGAVCTLEHDVSEPIQMEGVRWQTGAAFWPTTVCGELVVARDAQLVQEADECLHRQLVGSILKQPAQWTVTHMSQAVKHACMYTQIIIKLYPVYITAVHLQ